MFFPDTSQIACAVREPPVRIVLFLELTSRCRPVPGVFASTMGNGASAATAALQSATPAEVTATLSAFGATERSKLRAALEPSSAALSFPCLYPMNVIRWRDFETIGELPRSDEASKRGLLEDFEAASDELTCVFISHSWWDREIAGSAKPDYSSGSQKNLKFKTIVLGVRELIKRENLDASKLALWCVYPTHNRTTAPYPTTCTCATADSGSTPLRQVRLV